MRLESTFEFQITNSENIKSIELNKIILYLAGSSEEITDESIKKASIKFIKDARMSSDNDMEAIDHITYRLMSRVTNIEEANYLSKFLKEKLKINMLGCICNKFSALDRKGSFYVADLDTYRELMQLSFLFQSI